MMLEKVMLNGTWGYSPRYELDPLIFCFLVVLTICIECGTVYLFGRRKGWKDLELIVFVVFAMNWITAGLGLLILLWWTSL